MALSNRITPSNCCGLSWPDAAIASAVMMVSAEPDAADRVEHRVVDHEHEDGSAGKPRGGAGVEAVGVRDIGEHQPQADADQRHQRSLDHVQREPPWRPEITQRLELRLIRFRLREELIHTRDAR